MPLEHLGIGVPDVEAAKAYFDEFMTLVGFEPCFDNGYCPRDWQGTQIFLYKAEEPSDYSRHGTGLQHLAFLVSTRLEVQRVYEWARDRGDQVVRAPKAFPQYGPHQYATFILDPHGFMIEVITHEPAGAT